MDDSVNATYVRKQAYSNDVFPSVPSMKALCFTNLDLIADMYLIEWDVPFHIESLLPFCHT